MQIAKKQLLGFGGLAFVVAMTAFATTLPAGAVNSTATGNVDVYVQVYNVNFETVINNPKDGEVYSTSKISFSETHSHAYGVKYYLQRLNSDGTVAETFELKDYEVKGEDVSGNTNFELNLNEYGGIGTYVFRSVVTSSAGSTKEDAVQFVYAGIDAKQEDVVASSTDVNFRVYYTSGVKSLTYEIRNSKGETVSTVFKVNTSSPTTGGFMDLSIDLTEMNLASDEYSIYIVGFDGLMGEGDIIDTAMVTFKYTAPDAPNVPDTGSLFGALNISRADYLITGLIGFVAISIVALIVIKKTHKKQQ